MSLGKTSSTAEGDAKDENVAEGGIQKKKSDQKPTIKDLPFDRQLVATKLAAALVMQGRDDISTEDMDKLIYIFILLVKISKDQVENEGETVLTKDVLPVLGIIKEQSNDIPAMMEEIIENEVSALVAEAEADAEEEVATEVDKDTTQSGANALESLTDSDLQTLLQNFKHLSTEEQHHLIAHLKKLETADPIRVEKLRKYVNAPGAAPIEASSSTSAGGGKASTGGHSKHPDSSSKSIQHSDYSPPGIDRSYSGDEKEQDHNSRDRDADRREGDRSRDRNYSKFIDDEDEDDDYNVDEMFKAASSNVRRINEESRNDANNRDTIEEKIPYLQSGSQRIGLPISNSSGSSQSGLNFNQSGLNISLTDTQNLIANLMGSLQQSSNQFSEKNNLNVNAKELNNSIATVIGTQRQTVPSKMNSEQFYQQHQQQTQQSSLMNSQQQQLFPGYKQQSNVNSNPSEFFNTNYNNAAAFTGYNWSNGQISNNQMPFNNNLQNFGNPQILQQQQHAYNMFGRGGGNK